MKGKKIGFPCPYTVFNEKGWYGCAILSELEFWKWGTPPENIDGAVLCVWFWDLYCTCKGEVPKVCPRGLSFEEIDAKIQLLLRKEKFGKFKAVI